MTVQNAIPNKELMPRQKYLGYIFIQTLTPSVGICISELQTDKLIKSVVISFKVKWQFHYTLFASSNSECQLAEAKLESGTDYSSSRCHIEWKGCGKDGSLTLPIQYMYTPTGRC